MKHHFHLTAAVISALFCASTALPALAAPTGEITYHHIMKETVPNPYNGAPQPFMTVTTKYKATAGSTKIVAYLDYNFSAKGPYETSLVANIGQSHKYTVAPNTTCPEQTPPKLGIGYYSPGWTYTSTAVLQDGLHYSSNPADWLDSSTVSFITP